jgi:hypothetical protein
MAQSKAFDFDYYQLGRTKIADFLDRTINARRGDTIMVEINFVLDLVSLEYWICESYEQRKQMVDMVIDRGGVPVASKIDRIDRVDETTFEIFDYKTNAIQFTQYEIENSLQLGVYDLFLRAVFPEAVDVVCVFDMVRHGRFPTDFDDAQRENLRYYLINLWHQIRAESEPEERINNYCTWCERKLKCTKYQKALTEDPVIDAIESNDPDTLLGLHDFQEDLKNRIKILEAESKRINEMLSEKIVQDNFGEPLQLGDKEIYLQPNPRYTYPIRDIYKILQSKRSLVVLKDIVNVSNTALERTLKNRPDLKELIEPLKQTSFAASSLKARRKKTAVKKD